MQRHFIIRNAGIEYIVLDILHYRNIEVWRIADLKTGEIRRVSSENMDHNQESFSFKRFINNEETLKIQ